jgi:hypothetical protein
MLSVITVHFCSYAQNQDTVFDKQFAQKFSGAWKLNKEKSAKNKSLARFEEWSMQIRQNKGAIKIIRTMKIKGKARTDELIYYLDNRGEENPTGFGEEKRKTMTLWTDGKIIMRFTLSTYANGDFLKQDIADTWEVSSDGHTLTITTEAGNERGNMSQRNTVFQPSLYQKVFDRVP